MHPNSHNHTKYRIQPGFRKLKGNLGLDNKGGILKTDSEKESWKSGFLFKLRLSVESLHDIEIDHIGLADERHH